jgi:ferredoxin--NADP+ reductase
MLMDGRPSFPKARMNLVRPARPATARVVSNELCMRGKSASFVKHLVLDVGGTPLEGSFLPGQSFGVITPGADERGRPHKVRLYSIACPSWGEDGAARLLSTTPKRLIDEFKPQRPGDDPSDHRLFLGVCSNYLCDLKAGDPVQVTGPNGKRFLLPETPAAHDYLFIATGTGIAPFRGMILELLDEQRGPSPSRIELVMGAPYTTDLLYDELFRQLAQRHSNFRYHTAISRESGPVEGRGRYVGDLIGHERDQFLPLLENGRTLIYMCGLLGMQHGVFRALGELGVESGYVEIPDQLRELEPAQWSSAALNREAEPTPRCLLELY